MDLSIIILNYKTKGLVKQCVKSIELLNLGLEYEIIVVDNASDDGCLEMIRAIYLDNKDVNFKGYFKLIASAENAGYTAGNNLGLKQSVGKYVMILNPDITVLHGAIEIMISFLEKYDDAGMVGPKLINPDGSVQMSCYHFPQWYMPVLRRTFIGRLPSARKKMDEYLMRNWNHDKNISVPWLLGAGIMIKKEALQRVGLMDERFLMYYSDVDWCRRFWENNYAVCYLSDAEMVHYHQRLSAETPGIASIFNRMTRIHITDAIKYYAKYLGAKEPQVKMM
ncbi:glycosyltransferase family 2 protein [Candidatus Parcubacteria bacterium]|nr:MAG: glycosyltransferase family 2 protein [Candidatus Parcubacteria bacterium]